MVKTVDNFANIGKAVLIQALGLQKNYTEILETTEQVIDYSNPACSECKYRSIVKAFDSSTDIHKGAVDSCNNCPKKQYTTNSKYTKVYHNEKNKYGYKPLLKNNAIKLFLLLHFNNHDRFGIAQNIDTRVLATTLSCNIKTVYNNLEILKQYNYISYSKNSTYSISLCLCDYESYYLPAQKGGRGFFVMSSDLLMQILAIDNLVSLRLHLRELIELDNLSIKGRISAFSKSYAELKKLLPSYCKPGIIRKAMENSCHIFDISITSSNIRFEIIEQYDSKLQKEKCYNQYVTLFTDFIQDFNSTVVAVNVDNFISKKYSEFFDIENINTYDHYHMINLNDTDIMDLAQLSIQYSYGLVLDAYSEVYKTYIMQDKKITNLGGLVRTIILSKFDTLSLAA